MRGIENPMADAHLAATPHPDPPMIPLLLLAILSGVLAWTLRDPLFTSWRRARIRARPFPAEWRDHLRRHVPYVHTLPVDLQLQLKKHIQVFLAEKPFIGCLGLE